MLSSLALLLCAHAVVSSENSGRSQHNIVSISGTAESSGCIFEGLRYTEGASVRTHDVCLVCVCGRGALSCRRRACAQQPKPPSRCHVVYRRGDCCSEMHCPDGVRYLDQTAPGRLEDSNIEMPSSIGHACVEGGTVYAAGSAMSSSVACEQCFCLGGARHCVRPRCLSPPPGCTARPSAGACCPQRYYCEHGITTPPSELNSHDCLTRKGNWVNEGERVTESEVGSNCMQCFCLRGSIRCQHLSCAPTLQGCKPVVRSGQCCAHQYACYHHTAETHSQNLSQWRQNTLFSLKEETRSFHSSKSTKREATPESRPVVTDKSIPVETVTKEDPLKSTTKVKRKSEDIEAVSLKADTTRMMMVQTTNDITTTITETTTEIVLEKTSQEVITEPPEGSVKIIINGTINCTSELSSSPLLLNITDANNTTWNKNDPRIPLIDNYNNLEHAFYPNDIITEGSYNANFDENDTITINVSTSLKANSTRIVSSMTSSTALPKLALPTLLNIMNITKTNKEEFDYDYTEPTLPPSLPNLKIIPFVAADAVVDDEISSKEMPNYTALKKEDKFPVYYPSKNMKETIFATRKEDIYNVTHYSIYSPGMESKDESQYPGIIEDESVNIAYPSITNDSPIDVHEYTVTASFGNPAKLTTNIKSESNFVSNFETGNPVVNLFSPPAETEGGFVPRNPDLNEDFYSVYQSTPSGPVLHLTTSMQLETKDKCVLSDGRRVPEGKSISFACSLCSCAWGKLQCSPRPCHTPSGCKRLTLSKNTADFCCGELICDYNNKTTKKTIISPSDSKINLNETKVQPLVEDKEILNVKWQNNNGFDSILTYNNRTLQDNITFGNLSSIKNQSYQNTVNNTASKSTGSDEATLNTLATEKIKIISNHSVDYEEDNDDDDDDDDDEGFSLGSVLKLLLSETYESTTPAPFKKKPTTIQPTSKVVVSTKAPTTIKKPAIISDDTFVPVTHRYPYIPHKQTIPQFDTVDRIDHLVLGEASAIRKTSIQPAVTHKPVTLTTRRIFSTKTSQRPVSTNSVEISNKVSSIGQSVEIRTPSNFLSGFALGLPKLAGCNIYGRMYRVGRIIAELSSPCQECKCTELGVQCRSLKC